MSFNSRPVITIQVGHYANFVGAHFWNCQDLSFSLDKEKNDIDHDVFFREGLTLQGNHVTYTPRLVTVDLKGALGSLPEFGDLYHEVGGAVSKTDLSTSATQYWNHNVEVKRDETHKRTKYLQQLEAKENKSLHGEQKDICNMDDSSCDDSKHDELELESEVKLWTDFLRTRFHPKTNVIINDFHHNNSSEPFDIFGYGTNAWNDGTYAISDEFEDRIRFFVEEADSFKGFQLMTDVLNGFGGVTASMTDYLKDDYGSQCLLTFPVIPCVSNFEKFNPNVAANEVLNLALTLKSLAETSSLITPLSLASDTYRMCRVGNKTLPGFQNHKPEVDYHSSALLSLALDTLTMPWRLLRGPYATPYETACGLNSYGRKIANLQMAAPFPKPMQDRLSPYLKNQTNQIFKSENSVHPYMVGLSPHSAIESPIWCQSISTRGVSGSEATNLDFLEFYSRTMSSTQTSVINSKVGVQIGLPFPKHTINEESRFYWDPIMSSLPTLTSWNSNSTSGDIAKVLSERVRKIKLSKMHRFQDAGLEEEDFESTIESLTVLSECYQKPSDVI